MWKFSQLDQAKACLASSQRKFIYLSEKLWDLGFKIEPSQISILYKTLGYNL